LPELNLLGQLAVSIAASAGVFAALVLALAPRRMLGMATRLHRALRGQAG
jgi:hypothetical protein